jgi:capsular polysaccharide biosynthesis protein
MRKFEFQRLAGEMTERQNKYMLYQNKLEEARISEAMDQEKLLNVSIIERAADPAQRITGKERGMLTLILAACTGLAVGICIAIGLDFLKNSIANENELEKQLGLPVLAAIELFPSK